jgi:ketosteroid isomerase-like protein
MEASPQDEQIARELLAELQDAVVARDVDWLSQIFDDDVALFGTGGENLDREQSLQYLRRVVALDDVIRWDWTRVRPLTSGSGVVSFAVVGTVGFEGWSDEQRQAFRLTCVAVNDGTRWRLRHFHGSVPEQN